MSRELKFLVRNSLNYDNAKKYVKNSCDVHNIKDYSFKSYIDDEVALWTKINDKQFIVYLDHNTLETKVSTGGDVVRVFSMNDSAWNHAIEYLSKQADSGK